MQAVDEYVTKHIVVTPNQLSESQLSQFQPTSTAGVTFPDNDYTPTILVKLGQPAQVQSVTIPLRTTPGANVQQFEVTFYGPNKTKINDKPILSNLSPSADKPKKANINQTQIPSDVLISDIEITILATTDGKSPTGVVLDIKACTESWTGEYLILLYNLLPVSNYLLLTFYYYRNHI